MSKADNIAKHRLGVARKALKEILEYEASTDWYDGVDYKESFYSLKLKAEAALKDMENIK